jgi:hypothetical protein
MCNIKHLNRGHMCNIKHPGINQNPDKMLHVIAKNPD